MTQHYSVVVEHELNGTFSAWVAGVPRPMKRLLTAFALLVVAAPGLRAENATTTGKFVVEPPTLICLGFEWRLHFLFTSDLM
jgi:hypothetical protein